MKKILVLSGKGGTGKTTITSTLIDLINIKAFADCDVDAPNLHLINSPKHIEKKEPFEGMKISRIDESLCIGCNRCFNICRFDAIIKKENKCQIDPLSCEGCTVCQLVCPTNAISSINNIVGNTQVYKDEIVFSTAKLNMGSGNSGKLVTQVKKNLFENVNKQELAIIDGSPGIGCPVIASLSGIDLALLVTEPTLSGMSDLTRIVQTARIFKTKIAIILNKCDLSNETAKQIKEYANNEGIPFLGTIPYDKNVSKTINEGKSLALIDCKATRAISSIKNRILNELI